MRNLNLDQLQTLIAIADLGTFAAAAQALHLAPPTVSMHIKELESRLGAELVVRGRRQAGGAMLRFADRVWRARLLAGPQGRGGEDWRLHWNSRCGKKGTSVSSRDSGGRSRRSSACGVMQPASTMTESAAASRRPPTP